MKLLTQNGKLNKKVNFNNKKVIAAAGLSIALSINPFITAYAVPGPIDKVEAEPITGHVEPGYGITLPTLTTIKFDTNEIYTGTHLSEDNLSHIKTITVPYIRGIDYSFFNKMINVEEVNFKFYTDEIDLSVIDASLWLKPVDVSLSVANQDTEVTSFNAESLGFLRTIPNIGKLTVGNNDKMGDIHSFIINQEFIEGFTNTDTLELYINNESNYNYKDLSNYKNIILHGKPYDVIMYMNAKQLGELIKNGTNVEYEYATELSNINMSLEQVVNSFNLSENATDKEKLDAILKYTLLNFSYSPVVSSALASGTLDEVDISCFYENGFLDGAFREPQAVICGNFAAVVASLCNYLDVDAYMVLSGDHAFNEVVIDNKPYVVDATWLDDTYAAGKTAAEVFTSNEQDIYNLPYYLSDPKELYELPWYDSHCPWVTANDFYVDTYDFTEMNNYFTNVSEILSSSESEKVRRK